MKTLLLDTVTWDLVLDVNGNIALASEPYSLAQDAASSIRTFLGECWYNTTIGIPYFPTLLGKAPNVPLIKTKMEGAALAVPGVVRAKCFITSIAGRRVTGQVQVTDSDGTVTAAAF
ncbi:hypothetical protein LJR220_003326 [Bradyrhizobium sp. LjRoot220]|uniref:hypothetical protein n=1 Tax=Bradyrhizobium sp. LjRoot220 TaxID=3342284 RepID=UPI003ED02095